MQYLSRNILPSKPTVSVTSGNSLTKTSFYWNACSNTDHYELKIYNSSGTAVVNESNLKTTSFSKILSAGTYSIEITAVYNESAKTVSDRNSFTVSKITPGKPTVTVSAGNSASNTNISWNKCSNADSYTLVIYKSDGTTYKTVSETTERSFSGVIPTGSYYAIVTSKNHTDNTTAASAKKSFTVEAVVPETPTLNVLAGNNYTDTVFSWNSCDNADKYKLEVVNADTSKTVISETITATQYSAVLSAPGNYTAKVTALNSKEGTSAVSKQVTFVVESADVTEFTVSVSGKTDSVIRLTWTESKNADQYDVYRYENGAFVLAGTTAERTFTDTGLYLGTEYSYYVTASNTWSSINSNQVTAKTIQLTLNGSGTESDPYQISSAEDLLEFAGLINNSETNAMFNTAYYKQTADIDLSGISWTPIGTLQLQFKGHYNGNYCTITGLNVNTSAIYAGFFGFCASAVLENMVVYGTVTSTNNGVGGITGEIGYSGRIENCAFYGDVSGSASVGGIVGNMQNGGTLVRCYHIGAVSGTERVGGIAGQARVGTASNSQNISISYCYHAGGNVTGTTLVSGIAGKEDIGTAKTCTITYQDCYYLNSNASSGANGTTNAGIVAVNETVLQNLTETLGEPYTENTSYPVFKWQAELYSFKGQGTASSPYQIGTAQELQTLSEYVNDPYLNTKYGNACYVQTADIDLSGIAFIPVGTAENPFNGTYNGGYHTISNLSVSGAVNGGLFGYAENISIKNLIVDGSVNAETAGGLVGAAQQLDLSQAAFIGTVSGTTAGGLAGLAVSGKIVGCYQSGAVTGTNAGGLVGMFSSESTAPETLVIRSSYHGNGKTGSGIIGSVSGSTAAILAENSYYLKDSASAAVGGKTFSGTAAVNATVLTALAVTLEGTFTDNTDTSLNSGYPVFAWQLGRYEFTGSGTEDDPYLIGTADDLIALQEYVNDPSYNAVYGTAYYLQTADIDLGDMEWTAIGMSSELVFNGVYDGGYFTIYGLNASGETYSGLFGQVGATSGGRNAGVYNVIIKYGTSSSATGVTGGAAAVLMNGASVDSCGVIGDLTGDTGVGGVVGIVRRSASITNSFHNGDLTGTSMVGGILGTVESGTVTIENCYHAGGTVNAQTHAGAIAGYIGGAANIENCYYLNIDGDNAVDNAAYAGVSKVNAEVLKALAVTLGEAFADNIFGDYYNDGYPIFAEQFKYDITLIIGDINMDGRVDVLDLVLLRRYMYGDYPYIEDEFFASDVTSDGLVDAFDMAVLKKMLIAEAAA